MNVSRTPKTTTTRASTARVSGRTSASATSAARGAKATGWVPKSKQPEVKLVTGQHELRSASIARAFTDGLTKQLGIAPERQATRTQVTQADDLAFLRAHPALFAFDEVGAAPLVDREDPQMTIVRDAHLYNFGSVRLKSGAVGWGLNDFDQATKGSPASDLRRLATSIVVTARSAKLGATAEKVLIGAMTRTYAQEVSALSDGRTPTLYIDETTAQGPVASLLRDASQVRRRDFLEELTDETKQGLRFKTNGSLQPVSAALRKELTATLEDFASRLPADARVKRPLVVLDVAEQLGKGGSSNGMDRYAVLVEHATPDKRPIVLEVKHCPPVPTGKGVSTLKPSNAKSVVSTQKKLGGFENPLTGAITLDGKSMLVRELEPAKAKLDAADLSEREALEATVRQAARVIANAHAKSGGASIVAQWIGDDAAVMTQRLTQFAQSYADQVKVDREAVAN